MKDLVENIARALVDQPEEVSVGCVAELLGVLGFLGSLEDLGQWFRGGGDQAGRSGSGRLAWVIRLVLCGRRDRRANGRRTGAGHQAGEQQDQP